MRRLPFLSVCSALMTPGLAASQTPPQPLKPVDQGVADLGPLSTSFRDMQVDLRGPAGFVNVYHVPGADGMFMRGSGGLFAIFPRSQYVPTPRGILAQVPAGTVFHIGLPPAVQEPTSTPDDSAITGNDSRVRRQFDARLDLEHSTAISRMHRARGDEESSTTDPRDRTSAVTVATSETYRAQRISELIAQAAAAQKQQFSIPPATGD